MQKTPYIDPEFLGDQIQSLYNDYPYIDTIGAILVGFDESLGRLDEMAEQEFSESTGALEAWGVRVAAFRERISWYERSMLGSGGPNEIQEYIVPPLFEGEYAGVDYDPVPPKRDIETLWEISNEFYSLKSPAHEHMDFAVEDAQAFISQFWAEVCKHLIGEMPGDEEIDEAIGSAVECAEGLSEESAAAVSLGAPTQGPERASLAPLLLGIGAILLMSRRK